MFPDITKFQAEGATKSEHRQMKRGFVIDQLVLEMRSKGYVPVLDIHPVTMFSYLEEKDVFQYWIAVYGIEVDDPWIYEGWLSGRLLQTTMKTRLGQFSKTWESL